MISLLMTKLLGGDGAILAIVGALFAIKSSGKRAERKNAKMKDLKNAEDIRNRASTSDERLRDHDDAGWRD
jgi:flagellar basal body P-ring protein FlgI